MNESDSAARIRSAHFGEVLYPPGGTLGPRLQTCHQFLFLRRGRCEIHLDGEVYHADPGMGFLLLPGRTEFFAYDREQQTDHTWVHFHWAGGGPETEGGLPALPFTARMTDGIEKLIDLGIEYCSRGQGALYSELTNRLAECVWLEFSAQCPADYAPAPPLHPAVQRAQVYIDQHWREDVRLDAVARHAHVTPRHLIRLFQQHLGETPIQYLWNLRTSRAIGLLKSSGLRIGEVADQAGFRSAAHFARAIKEHTGVTPRTLRKHHWQRGD